METRTDILIYGSYGYTGNLIAELCKEKGYTPVLAGRNSTKLKEQANRLGFPYLAFDLAETDKLESALSASLLVIHSAGPFQHTALPMMKACLKTKTHYVDITGEIRVFEMAASFDEAAKKAGIMMLPGAGFDVVPSDCLAAYLKSQLPDAIDLKLAIRMIGRVSHGTATTMIENVGEGGAVRKNGKITKVPAAYKSRKVDFGNGKLKEVTTIPWGDVSTAWHSTKIPNIEVYAAIPSKSLKMARWFGWLMATAPLQKFLKRKIKQRPAGPDDNERKNGRSLVWGRVTNKKGDSFEAVHSCPEGYTLTALTSVLISEKIRNGEIKTGFQTPSLAYGADLILEVDGVERINMETK